MTWTRREFLQAGSLAGVGLGLGAGPARRNAHGILLRLTGGPGQLDTWDPKPEAPSTARSPYRAIATNVPGIRLTELFPRMARHADRYALVRSVYHDAPATHEAGLEALRCGPAESPLAKLDLQDEPEAVRARYGHNRFGERCLAARRLVESGAPFVTVDMFGSVFQEITWDAHGFAPFSSLAGYRDHVAPQFDLAYTALLEDLERRGLFERTLVVATGEFGRTPWFNAAGGRDHWPGCWTVLFAGGGVRGGQVLGESDGLAAAPRERPVALAEVVATVQHFLGARPSAGVPPLQELFA